MILFSREWHVCTHLDIVLQWSEKQLAAQDKSLGMMA